MKIDKVTLSEMQAKCAIAWQRLIEIYPTIKGNLNERTASDLWFKTWASVSYDDRNPNVLRDKDGERLFKHNPNYDLYPCDADDTTMKAAYKRIVKYIQENGGENE